jgi:thiopeptide-type bacteriocin biosynthesis protein
MKLHFFPSLIVRAPRFPFTHTASHENLLMQLGENRIFMEALFVASPVLYDEFTKLLENREGKDAKKIQKIQNSVLKYYHRMCSRSTPFGLFSGLGTATWGNCTHLQKQDNATRLFIKADMSYLLLLAQYLEQQENIRYAISYQVNSSLYWLDGEYRYYQSFVNGQGEKTSQLNAIDDTEDIRFVLQLCSAAPVHFHTLARQLQQFTRMEDTAAPAGFIDSLIEAQVLLSIFTPQLTGNDYLQQLIQVVATAQQNQPDTRTLTILHTLEHLRTLFKQEIDHDSLIPHLRQIHTTASQIPVPCELSRLFHIDTHYRFTHATAANSLQDTLSEAVHVLSLLSHPNPGKELLETVKQRLQEQYEQQPVKLAHLADPDIGLIETTDNHFIDFGNERLNTLNQYIPRQQNTRNSPRQHPAYHFLAEKLLQSYKHHLYTIVLNKEDIQQLESERAGQEQDTPLPDTFPIVFQLIDGGDAQVLLEHAGGSGGTSLVARFSEADEDLNQLLQTVTAYEAGLHTEELIAEIIHLPENRTANILRHPATRPYEIPYLAASSLPPGQQISINDIYVTVHNNQLKLYSQSKQQFIIPYIDNAHNYMAGNLPLYQFFGALQAQEKHTQLQVEWPVIPSVYFFPRLQYRQTILSPAQWRLPLKEFQLLLTAEKDNMPLATAMQSFATQWMLPRYFCLADADQTQLVDTEDLLSIQAFVKELKQRQEIHLKEYLLPATQAGVTDQDGCAYAHQLIAIAKPAGATQPDAGTMLPQRYYASPKAAKTFMPGSEWVYYKIYCSSNFSNQLLYDMLYRFIQQIKEAGLISHWFFVRYRDTHDHLRLRFRLHNTEAIHRLLLDFNNLLHQEGKHNLLWKIQLDTYQRETERYGTATIEEVESLFHIDSEYIIQVMLQNSETSPLLLALLHADALMQQLGFTVEEKLHLSTALCHSFNKEMNTGKPEKEVLQKYYHEESKKIQALLNQPHYLEVTDPPVQEIFNQKQRLQQPVVQVILGKITDRKLLYGIASDLIHMHFNRLFPSHQRRHEMIGYNLLTKHYSRVLMSARQPDAEKATL